jgi:putative transposase
MTENKSYSKIWVHSIISTQNRLPLILSTHEERFLKLLNECFSNQVCNVEAIGGTSDHVHIVFLLNEEKSVKSVINSIIEESQNLINNELFPAKSFGWSTNWSAFGISESQLVKVVEYIKNQKEIHKNTSFSKEYNEFLRLHGYTI